MGDHKHAERVISLIFGESLLELAIRIGINDLVLAPSEIAALLGIPSCVGSGMDLTPDGAPTPVHERTVFDEFQDRISELQRLKGEGGAKPVFRNAPIEVPDIAAYLAQGPNIRFMHGYPREAQDLPAICIALGGESEKQEYLGQNKFELVASSAGGETRVRLGSDMEADYHIHIISPNYDETVVLFHLVKYALLKYRVHLEGYGLRDMLMNWQACEPAPDYLQGGLFIYQRSCVVSLTKDENFVVSLKGRFNELSYGVAVGGAVALQGQIAPEDA